MVIANEGLINKMKEKKRLNELSKKYEIEDLIKYVPDYMEDKLNVRASDCKPIIPELREHVENAVINSPDHKMLGVKKIGNIYVYTVISVNNRYLGKFLGVLFVNSDKAADYTMKWIGSTKDLVKYIK